ncbi:GTP cyclohydrolase 1 [Bienertia sinuspersici]
MSGFSAVLSSSALNLNNTAFEYPSTGSTGSVDDSLNYHFNGVQNHWFSPTKASNHVEAKEMGCYGRVDDAYTYKFQLEKDGSQSSPDTYPKCNGSANIGKLSKEPSFKGLWNHPNRLSEEMVRCMRSIFISLAESAPLSNHTAVDAPSLPHAHPSNAPSWSLSEHLMVPMWAKSPQIDLPHDSEVLGTENTFDPYKVSGKLSWIEIGRYGLATEVSWMSVGKSQLEYAAGSLRRFRILVEQLAKVNPLLLSSDEKLAFWINLYNALIMHAYLAYGVPRSEMKFFSLLQKAAYTVSGHLFSAAVIEYVILKMRPPIHRPQIALLLPLNKLKVSEEQKKFAIDSYEPSVAFAVSCGMYSSPAVQVFTAKNVRDELQAAQRDFIRASVGVSSKGKLLVPKMLQCFAKNYVEDSKLAQWVSRYLPPEQAAFIDQHITQKRQKLFGSRNCGVLSFDSRFRYLFLPEMVYQ